MAVMTAEETPRRSVDSERLSAREIVIYGCGDLAFSLCWNTVGAFLLYFYTNVALISISALGTLFLLARLLDAAIDPAVGILVDKTRSRWGRTRPYFLFGTLPFCILMVLTFLSPDLSATGKLIYAYATFVLLGIAFSFVSIPCSALMPMMTRAPDQRLQLGSSRSVGTSISVIVATSATMPLVGLLGGTNEKLGFALVAALFALVSLILSMLVFFNCRERNDDETSPDFAILPAFRDMVCNRAWLITFIFTVLNFIRFGAVLSVTAFFAIEVLKRPWTISVLLPAVSGMLVLGAFIAPPILKRSGIRTGCIAALLAAIAVYLVLPFTEWSPWLFIGTFMAASVLISITMSAIFTMAADSIDYHEWKSGGRNEGLLSAGITLATKVGMAIGAAVIAYSLAWAGYKPTEVSPLAHDAIRWSYYGWAIAAMLLQIVCIIFWPMDGLHQTIRDDLNSRRSAQSR